MEALRHYAFVLISASILCAVIIALSGTGKLGELVRMLCGVVLTLSVLAPVTQLDFSDILQELIPQEISTEAAAYGQELSRQAWADIIKSESEAYILTKAAELNADIHAEVLLSDGEIPVPQSVEITGRVTPYVRSRLEQILIADLGITKEALIWTG